MSPVVWIVIAINMVHFRSNVMFLEGVRAITSRVALSVINVAMDYGVCLVKSAKVVLHILFTFLNSFLSKKHLTLFIIL